MKKIIATAISLSISACHVEPPAMPDDDQQRQKRARSDGRAALARQAEAETAVAQAKQDADTAAEALRAAEAQNQLHEERQRSASAELEKYARSIEDAKTISAGCSTTFEKLLEVHEYLVKFVSEPERDAAIRGLEPCRKIAARTRVQNYANTQKGMREEFALEREEAFDEANPYRKGNLVAKVKGDVLYVTMRGNFEGRARHSQSQVDAWCESTSLFTSIILKNSHGTFTCRPVESPKEVSARLVQEEGLAISWVPVPAGDVPTPQLVSTPPPVDSSEIERLRQESTQVAIRSQAPEADLASAQADAERARGIIRRIDRQQEEREEEWESKMQESAKAINGAGVGLVIAGGVATVLGAYSAYLRSQTTKEIGTQKSIGATTQDSETKLGRQTGAAIAGISIGLPLVIVGAILIVSGKRRRDAVQSRLSAVPGGLAVMF